MSCDKTKGGSVRWQARGNSAWAQPTTDDAHASTHPCACSLQLACSNGNNATGTGDVFNVTTGPPGSGSMVVVNVTTPTVNCNLTLAISGGVAGNTTIVTPFTVRRRRGHAWPHVQQHDCMSQRGPSCVACCLLPPPSHRPCFAPRPTPCGSAHQQTSHYGRRRTPARAAGYHANNAPRGKRDECSRVHRRARGPACGAQR